MRALHALGLGLGAKRRAREMGIARNRALAPDLRSCVAEPAPRRPAQRPRRLRRKLLIDPPGPLVVGEDREFGTARIHSAFAALCKDWGVGGAPCQPYRARTKGTTESGVGYWKKNALAAPSFTSFAALEANLERWTVDADRRRCTSSTPSNRDAVTVSSMGASLPIASSTSTPCGPTFLTVS